MRVWTIGLLCLTACEPATSVPRPVLLVAGGTLSGGGSLGLALAATVTGPGADGIWQGSLSDASGLVAPDLELDGADPLTAWWWAGVPARTGVAYELTLRNPSTGETVAAYFLLDELGPTSPPTIDLVEGSELVIASAAAATHCMVFSEAGIVVDAWVSSAACDVSGLPAGAYTASILTFTSDVSPGAAEPAAWPAMFSVTQSELAFALGDAGQSLETRAHGGAIDFGSGIPGLAVLLELEDAGLAPALGGTVSIVGPGIPSSAPLELAIPPNVSRHLAWSYDAPANAGSYSYTVQLGQSTLSGTFSLGTLATLPMVTGLTVSARPSGAADVGFSAVEGARSYHVSVWDRDSQAFAGGGWTAENAFAFPSGTFEQGRTYDVYVAAASVAMTSSTPFEGAVALSENTYLPETFVGQ